MAKKSNAVFLDVDSSIVENNLRITQSNEEDELNRLLGPALNQVPSKVIKPSPGFCVKTKEIGNETKIFVNVCKTDSIPPPKDISEEELLEIVESEDISDFKIPMSIGEMRPEKDKKGEEAKACDVAIHPSFFNKIECSPGFKSFFLAVVFQALEHKYGLVCVDEKIILKNRKCFGSLQAHRIQQREIEEKMGQVQSTSIIEEITGEKTETKKAMIETIASVETEFKEPEYRLYKRKGKNCLIGEFKLPDVLSVKELTLDIGEDRILLESKDRGYLVDIFVPGIIRQEGCSSTFEKNTKILAVNMPLVGG